MLRRDSFLSLIPAFFLVGVLGGCALSPQNVTLAPDIVLPANQVALSGPVTVTVFDERLSPWLGSRGGIYGSSNYIGISNSLQDAVQETVEKALQAAGMDASHSGEAPQFQVYVDTLQYHVPDASYVTKIDLKASIRVVVQADSENYQGSYSAEESRKVLKAPSDADNEKMVNEILSSAIERAFDDPGLMRFMARL